MILRLHQVVLVVGDLKRSIKFYSQFGFKPERYIEKKDGRTRVTLVQEGFEDFELKLFSNPKPVKIKSEDVKEYLKGIGTKYMTLLTDNIDDFYKTFHDKIKFISPPKKGMTGCKYAYFRDPDNILVEVYEKPKN